MAEWTVTLPSNVSAGDENHPGIHNAALDGVREIRSLVDSGALTGSKGDKGTKGDTGPAGPAGTDGADGADGFPSQDQWDALVARVDALETGAS